MSAGGMWLGYMFPSNITPVEAAVRSDTNRATAPKDFTFGYSNDWGLTWTTVHTSTDNVDWTSEERRVFDTLRVRPWWDPVWILEERMDDPDTVLEARTQLWHIDRVTHAVTVSDIISGEDGTLAISDHDYS